MGFQSTHSLRSATGWAGGDLVVIAGFNPRTPCGVRHPHQKMTIPPKTFQSTHSLRSATRTWPRLVKNVAVSIHALLAECDLFNNSGHLISGCFNPRTPCGVRRKKPFRQSSRQTVSIHALLAECDFSSTRGCAASTSFNPRTPCGVRLFIFFLFLLLFLGFNPRTPCGVRLQTDFSF